jgi:hypothetical protein
MRWAAAARIWHGDADRSPAVDLRDAFRGMSVLAFAHRPGLYHAARGGKQRRMLWVVDPSLT